MFCPMALSSMTLEHVSRSNQETIIPLPVKKNYYPVRFCPWRRFALCECSVVLSHPGDRWQGIDFDFVLFFLQDYAGNGLAVDVKLSKYIIMRIDHTVIFSTGQRIGPNSISSSFFHSILLYWSVAVSTICRHFHLE